MSSRVFGRFYFKMTANGNLIGEYSNRHPHSTRAYAEAATRISTGRDWVGDYTTTWCEAPNDRCLSARLEIRPKPDCTGIFRLMWKSEPNPHGKPLFSGEAMLCEEMLVGDYMDE